MDAIGFGLSSSSLSSTTIAEMAALATSSTIMIALAAIHLTLTAAIGSGLSSFSSSATTITTVAAN